MPQKPFAASYLLRRPSSWYLRFRLPNEIQSVSGRRELRLSLRTTDYVHARYQVGLVLPDLARLRLIDRLLAMQRLEPKTAERLIKQLHAEMVERLYAAQMHELEDGRMFSDNDLAIQNAEYDWKIERLKLALRENDFHYVSAEVEKTLREQGVEFSPETPDFRYMCIELIKQQIMQSEIFRARVSGDFRRARELRENIVPPERFPVNGSRRQELTTVSDAWKEFYQEMTTGQPVPEWNDNTAQGMQAKIEEFMEILGDVPVAEPTRELIIEYRDKLALLPKNRRKFFGDKSVAELIAMNLSPDRLPAPRTVDDKLTSIKSFLSWCHRERNYLASNPASSVKVKARSNSYAEFSQSDLEALFHSEAYRTNGFRRTWQYWIPLIGLYSGARLGEICQLMASDILEEDGIWVFNITDAGEGQKIKTTAGIRKVPIHENLRTLGLVEYAQGLKNESRLFPDLKRGVKGWSQYPSRWFGEKYKKMCGIRPDPSGARKVFHSFRHTAITKAMGSEGIQLQHCQQAFGHEKRLLGETATYTHAFPLQSLVPVVASLQFGLSHPPFRRPSAFS